MSLVEYHDPDNVFDVVAPDIYRRLPLTNLHWKASARPLRSIESLHVDFVRADGNIPKDASLNKSPPGAAENNDVSSSPSVLGAEHLKQASATRAQRHQIPGLRQTPYLKLFLLRCDDKETYKTESRDALREWMKENVSSSSAVGNSQDDHDAFEWLILHVVLPNTFAACEPRWSQKNSGTDEEGPKEISSSSARWTGKGSRTILERLRADFNQSNKSAPDRIAQIRLAKESVPDQMIPTEPPTGVTQLDETPKEHGNACNDLISKMKALILRSFDLRVSQYEDDIKEKENQQFLPGWNFCTFFVLKEGLARAFESVGLLDDALAVYDELDAGLDISLRGHPSGVNDGQATSFLAFTPELHDKLVAATNGEASGRVGVDELAIETQLPLRSVGKNYRTLIVSNDISVLDFRCYLFAREMSLLLRLANIRPTPYPIHSNGTVSSQDLPGNHEPTKPTGIVHNAIALAELCRRAVQFVPSMARILRADLRTGFNNKGANLEDVEDTLDKVVLSTTYAVAQQILDETATSDIAAALPIHKDSANDTSKRSDRRSMRRSSLPALQKNTGSSRGQVFGADASTLYSHGLKNISPIQNSELANVAAYRAELYLLQRRALESIGKHVRLYIGRSESSSDENQGTSVNLKENISDANAVLHLSTAQLRRSLSSAEEFSRLYEALTDRAALNYAVANRIKSAEKLATDIAKLKLAEGDYAAAASYFSHVIPSFSCQSWNSIELSILHLYSECLKALHRKDEYVRVSLALLKRVAEARGSEPGHKSTHWAGPIRRRMKPRFDGKTNPLAIYESLFSELVEFATDLPYDFNSPFDVYFANLQIDSAIKPFKEHDGFKLRLKIQQFLANQVKLDRIVVRLINPADSQAREILLENEEPVDLGPEMSEIWLQSHASAIGRFVVEKVTFHAGRLVFVHEPLGKPEPPSLTLSSDVTMTRAKSVKSSSILLYQRMGAFFADLTSAKTTYIGQMRAIDVAIDTGSNEIECATLILRSATAGLRIHCGGAEVIYGQIPILDKQQPGRIEVGTLNAGSIFHIQVPYELERNVTELFIRLEIQYTTAVGQFLFNASLTVPIELPLDINVQDVFSEKFLYSKFLVQPQNSVPVHLLHAELSSSGQYHSEPLLRRFDPFMVFPHQPANVTFRISKKEATNASQGLSLRKPSLLLTVSFRSLQDDIISQVASTLENHLQSSCFIQLQRYLVQTLKKSLRLHFRLDEYQYSSITGRFGMPAFNAKFWADVLEGIGEADRQGLHEWLEQWHADNATLEISSPGDPDYKDDESPVNQVLIDFEVPHLQCLHIASLNLVDMSPKQSGKSQLQQAVASVGEPLQAKLIVRHTRRWDLHLDSQEKGAGTSTAMTKAIAKAKVEPEQFTYEIHANPADWLVIGSRRARFTAAPSEDADNDEDLEDDDEEDSASPPRSHTFALCLVPVRTGYLLLPRVDVLPVQREPRGESLAAAADGLSCQTDCTSVHQGVEVVEGMQSTTVGIGDGLEHSMHGLALLGAESEAAADV